MPGLGIDIGGSSVKTALVEGERVLATARSDAYDRPTLADLSRALEQAVESLGDARGVQTLGLCLPGRLSADGARVELAVNVPCLEGARVADLLPPRLQGTNTRVLSDAAAAALGLWREERLPGRLLAISIGTGVGAAVLDEGVPVGIGARGPGHFGHIDVSVGAPGRRLEQVVGLRALRDRFEEKLGDPGVLESLDNDDPIIIALARALRIAHAIYTPDHVRLLGGVGIALAPLLPRIRTRSEHDLTPVARPNWTLACGTSPFLAAIGAARSAAELPPLAP